jgi:hypothetical protein
MVLIAPRNYETCYNSDGESRDNSARMLIEKLAFRMDRVAQDAAMAGR